MKKNKKIMKKIDECHASIKALSGVQDAIWARLIKDLDKLDVSRDHIDWVWDYIFNDYGYENLENRLSK